MTEQTAVGIHKVTAFYKRQPVLTDLTIEISGGEQVALMGPNGSGKTTLIRTILGQVPYHGSVFIDGCASNAESTRAKAKLAYVPQNPSFPQSLTGAELVAFWQRLRGLKPDPMPVLEGLKLGSAAAQRTGTYSGGMLRRLSLALADIGDNRLMLLDEPESGLDRQGQAMLSERFEAWRKAGTTVLFTVHDSKRLPHVDRVIYLDSGELVYDGPAQQGTRVLTLEWRGQQASLDRLASRLGRLPYFGEPTLNSALDPALTSKISESCLVEALAALHPLESELRLTVREPVERDWSGMHDVAKMSEEAVCGTSG